MKKHHAMGGLTRIGTDEAWDEMIAVIGREENKAAAALQRDLLRIKYPAIRDPNISKKVEAAIE
jgi:hypothetical protein